jgi:hypothetical protein
MGGFPQVDYLNASFIELESRYENGMASMPSGSLQYVGIDRGTRAT